MDEGCGGRARNADSVPVREPPLLLADKLYDVLSGIVEVLWFGAAGVARG